MAWQHPASSPSPSVGRAGEGAETVTARAKKLRLASSPAERAMWRLLYPFRTEGFHFRKQAPIGPYFADIACHHAKLVIELDGETHGTADQVGKDTRRSAFLNAEGYTVLRFVNRDVLANPEGVFAIVAETLAQRKRNNRSVPIRSAPTPSLPTEGEGGPTDTSGNSAE